MKNYILLLLLCVLSSCSTQNFFKYIEYGNLEASDTTDKTNKQILSSFNKISDKTNHIIYLFIPTGDFEDTTFEGMIYDVENNKYYEISGDDKNVSVTGVVGFDKSNYSQFIISTYLSDRNYLKWLYDNNMSVGDVYSDILYDISLKEKKADELRYPNILFIDGKPFLETSDVKHLYDKGSLKPYKQL